MNEPDYEPDYIFAYQIQPERLATWKRTAEWYVPPKAAEQGDAEAQIKLGDMYYYEQNVCNKIYEQRIRSIGLAGARREAT